ncbi:glycosyltransferase family 39 protein [Candidatus Daviesbacteria bacterium]|nr:glycosyltransferase family 39 protein [Candidatus Daviesbacteria bacterium]
MNKISSKIILIIIISFIFRILLSFLPSFEGDESAFRFWSAKLVEFGPQNFYYRDFFTNNPIGFFYVLWFIGLVKTILFPSLSFFSKDYDLLLKFPSNLADILTGIFIYLIVKKRLGNGWGILGFIFYVFNPAVFFNTSIWGQYDGLATLFLVLSSYILLFRNNPELSIVPFAVALTLKPQAIAFGPALLIIIVTHHKFLRWIKTILYFIITVTIIYFPFFPTNPFYGLIHTNTRSLELFNCTTCFAFNFWGVFGNWKNDLVIFLNIPLLFWGIILLIVSYVVIFFIKLNNAIFKIPYIYLTVALSLYAFFIFLTRIHERYLFPFFAFFLLGASILKSKFLLLIYCIVSLLFLLNMYLPYNYFNHNLNYQADLARILANNFESLSIISVAVFLIALFYYKYKL